GGESRYGSPDALAAAHLHELQSAVVRDYRLDGAVPGSSPTAAVPSTPLTGAGPVAAADDGGSIFSACCSASRVLTLIPMRRLTAPRGFSLSNSTDEDRPTTRATLSAASPEPSSARRAAFARSVDKSQFV